MADTHLIVRVHAIRRMFERSISAKDVRSVISAGEKIEDYPGDQPYPSGLFLGWIGSRPLHVVVAENDAAKERIIVTVYEPGIDRWERDFKRRRNP